MLTNRYIFHILYIQTMNKEREMTPVLDKLINSGHVWLEDGVYYGRAFDGVMVRIGWGEGKESTEAYLKDHPSPVDW